ncbi:MAG: ABC transporter permease [Planctomycetota bacterium]
MSAVVSTLCIARYGGGEDAGAFTVLVCFLVGIAVCAATGAFSGLMVVHFSIPPFIVTLAMMMVARGMAYIIAGEASIYDLPDSIEWLGHGASLFGIPNTVVLMVILFVAAHILMSHTVLGRYIYAVGGNREAARLSGVPTKRVIFLAYVVSGAMAGLGGVIEASQLKSGSPRLGPMYELFVIAAVVVGGTSLSGGEGKILGTLIGAFIMGVIANGMNLMGVGSHPQKVVLGFMILGAVLLDKAKRRGMLAFGRMRQRKQ